MWQGNNNWIDANSSLNSQVHVIHTKLTCSLSLVEHESSIETIANLQGAALMLWLITTRLATLKQHREDYMYGGCLGR